jgi:hypothetical protein
LSTANNCWDLVDPYRRSWRRLEVIDETRLFVVPHTNRKAALSQASGSTVGRYPARPEEAVAGRVRGIFAIKSIAPGFLLPHGDCRRIPFSPAGRAVFFEPPKG